MAPRHLLRGARADGELDAAFELDLAALDLPLQQRSNGSDRDERGSRDVIELQRLRERTSFAADRDRLLGSAEGDLVELAFEIARRVLATAVDRAAVTEVAARALDAARLREHVAIRAHPEDLAALRAAEPELAARLVRARGVALREDAAVGRGGIIVETEAGRIDARLETQLAGLRRALAHGVP
jgi:flagellar biosynthesis/type III secretory pathway protein FliH